jgi:hypothetical protein
MLSHAPNARVRMIHLRSAAAMDYHVVTRPDDVFPLSGIDGPVSRIGNLGPPFKLPPHGQPAVIFANDVARMIGAVVVDDDSFAIR